MPVHAWLRPSNVSAHFINTDRRLGNTGAATFYMQLALGVMGSYIQGGASAAINLRDPAAASIVFISPPSEERRKAQEGGDVFKHQVKPSIDPDNYSRPRSEQFWGKAKHRLKKPQDHNGRSRPVRKVVRLGDTTSHGGKVVSSSATHFKVHSVPVACVGDTCTCPIPGHDGCTITSGSAHHLINGKRIAFDGEKLSCGATLISVSSTSAQPNKKTGRFATSHPVS